MKLNKKTGGVEKLTVNNQYFPIGSVFVYRPPGWEDGRYIACKVVDRKEMSGGETCMKCSVASWCTKAVCNLRDETGETYLKPACGSYDRIDQTGVYFEKIFST